MSTLAQLAIEGRLKATHWRILALLLDCEASDLAVLGMGQQGLDNAAQHLEHRGLIERLPGSFSWQLSAQGKALRPQAAPPAVSAPVQLPATPVAVAQGKPGHPFIDRPRAEQLAALRAWRATGARLDLLQQCLLIVEGRAPQALDESAMDYAERFARKLALQAEPQ